MRRHPMGFGIYGEQQHHSRNGRDDSDLSPALRVITTLAIILAAIVIASIINGLYVR
jgi:hypothetical protein